MTRKKYLQFLPVSADTTADLLKTDAVWEALNVIREKGSEGISSKKIAEETDQPLSTVYGAVRSLWRAGFVRREKQKRKRRRKPGRPKPKPEEPGRPFIRTAEDQRRMGKKPRLYYEPCDTYAAFEQDPTGEPENPWGDVVFSRDFNRLMGRKIEDRLKQSGISESLLDFTKKLYEDSKDDEELRDILPSGEICSECHKSHEGSEFIKAIVFYVATQVIDSPSCRKLMADLGLGSS